MLGGCSGDFHSVWREQTLPSGKVVKVTSMNLVWGVEHDERSPEKDCFSMEFVSNQPQAEPAAREQEAREVFELMRPVSEQWGFKHAEMAGFPTIQRKGHYDRFYFERGADGQWSCRREDAKVFAND